MDENEKVETINGIANKLTETEAAIAFMFVRMLVRSRNISPETSSRLKTQQNPEEGKAHQGTARQTQA